MTTKKDQADKSRAALEQRIDEARATAGEEDIITVPGDESDDGQGMLPCSMNIPEDREDEWDDEVDQDMVGAVDPGQPQRIAAARRIYDQRQAHRSIAEQQEGTDAIAERHREGRRAVEISGRASKNRYDIEDD